MNLEPFRSLARSITGTDETSEIKATPLQVRPGTVVSYDPNAQNAVVTIGGSNVTVKTYLGQPLAPGFSVDVLLQGGKGRIIGVTGGANGNDTGFVRLIAWASANLYTQGRSDGLYGIGTGQGQTSVPVSASIAYTGLGLTGVPILNNRLLRCKWHFPAAGPPDLTNEWYFQTMVQYGTGPVITEQETRFAPSGSNAPSPEGEVLMLTNSALPLTVTVNVQMLKNTGTLYRYGNTANFRSWITLEDLGPPRT